MMETLVSIVLGTHIVAGTLSLAAAPVALVVRKGSRIHRLSGRIFFWLMTWVFITAVFLSAVKWIPFLLMIAVFSYFNVAVGYRSVYHKHIGHASGIKWYDWAMVVVALLFNAGMTVYGAVLVIDAGATIGYVSLFFGIGGGFLIIQRLVNFIKPPDDRHAWLYNHIGHMIGGYIGSCTAFSVVTISFLPGFVVWVWPSLLGFPLLSIWIRYYKHKLQEGARLSDLVELKA
ncbi:MAG: hypothetical protein HC859_02930 [Bacteroidia bacterium]|nr:hypothetical protein [Bacteroidia bacterium]